MATHTLATAQNLVAVAFSQAPGVLSDADLATISQHILDDRNRVLAVPGAFCREGFLYVPNRGRLQVYPGDVVAYGSRGEVILVPADAIANGTSWTYT